ncbi:hypothetical protein AGMMS50212_12300 [Spirochaetia bacterium]|nr:hypothetical protein AGMMS50212_12300 [Spirochaetia bacterium]
MVDHDLINILNFKSKFLASRWKALIRKAPHLRHYNKMSDDDLIKINEPLYKHLARTLDRGLDRAVIGDFFVKMGKNRLERGFPLSETVFACNLSQQMIVDYLAQEFVLDSSVAVYQTLDVTKKINEFFFLGCFYMIKGFLEKTYTEMSIKHKISEDLLKTYFKDEFFFKQEEE